MLRFSILLLVFFSFNVVLGQRNISKRKIIKHLKVDNLEWIEFETKLAKVKTANNHKWGVYYLFISTYQGELMIEMEEVVPALYDEIGDFDIDEIFARVRKGSKYGILVNLEYPNAAGKIQCIYDSIDFKVKKGEYFALVKKDSLWGLVNPYSAITEIEPSFKNKNEVPLISVNQSNQALFLSIKSTLQADIVIFDTQNGDGVFKARNKYNHKWGMYQSTNINHLDTLVPPEYDSVLFFNFNSNFTLIYQQDKVGVYLSKWSYRQKTHESIPCIYDNFYILEKEGENYLALKKEGKWGWINWLTGEKQSEFQYNTVNNLPFPSYSQETRFK